ncbi:TetR family transcriptional regulator [Arthrobacter sp. LAPM80]|uniref:TetR family transcriptional regulator n=1 Tax=Arthrobacter sp. LAPM80 TaxID=3141788 RepID=UPI00398AAAA0
MAVAVMLPRLRGVAPFGIGPAGPAPAHPVSVGEKDVRLDAGDWTAVVHVLTCRNQGSMRSDGMTIDMVATRAKAGKATLYRRWPAKADLVLDTVACLKKADTGTLCGDLVAMVKPHSIGDGERTLQIMAGLRLPDLGDRGRHPASRRTVWWRPGRLHFGSS